MSDVPIEVLHGGSWTSEAEKANTLSANTVLATRDLFKSYRKGDLGLPVLQGIDMQVREGEFLAIVGKRGCYFDGHRIDNLASAGRDLLRNRHFGMIFQFYHLLPELTSLENVLAPALIAEDMFSYWARRGKYRRRAMQLLEMVGIADRAKHKPREM